MCIRDRARKDWFGNVLKGKEYFPIDKEILSKYYHIVDQPEQADFAIVCLNSPISNGYVECEGEGKYIPISLQYRPYKAELARKESIAFGDPLENTDRSYKGETAVCENEYELDILLDTKKRMKDKPVICCLHVKKPCILSEIEPYVDVLLIHFGIQNQAILDLISGNAEPSGLLPFQVPKDMKTVELQKEDVAFDMEPYMDTEGNVYDLSLIHI